MNHERVEERLRAHFAGRAPGVVSGYLFGSVADGRVHRESDVYLGVLLDRAILKGAPVQGLHRGGACARVIWRVPPALVDHLARLLGFRNVLIHQYVGLDLDRAVAALDALDPIEEFVREVAGIIEHWD